jgi:hypothetical protein
MENYLNKFFCQAMGNCRIAMPTPGVEVFVAANAPMATDGLA